MLIILCPKFVNSDEKGTKTIKTNRLTYIPASINRNYLQERTRIRNKKGIETTQL
jgi:hypothetical protein